MSTLRQIALLALNDLRLTFRDRATLIWMLALPVVFMWLFGQMGGSGGPNKVTLGIDDRDGGWLAKAVIAELKDDRINLQEVQPGAQPDQQEPPPRTLVIPSGFTAGVLAGKQQELRLESQPGSNQEFSLAAQVTAVRAIVRILGRLTEATSAVSVDSVHADLELRTAVQVLGRRPPLVRVKASVAGKGRAVPSGFAQSVPGTLTFFVLMMTIIYGGVFLTIEKQKGMIRRQGMLPISRGTLIAGKLAGRMLMAGAQIAIYLLAGRLIYGLSFGDSPAGLLLVLFAYAAAVAGLSLLYGALLHTPEQASHGGLDLEHDHGRAGRLLVAERGHAALAVERRARPPDRLGHGCVSFADLVRPRHRRGAPPVGRAARLRPPLLLPGRPLPALDLSG